MTTISSNDLLPLRREKEIRNGMGKKEKIVVQDTVITILSEKSGEYFSLTDMAGYKDNLEARIVVSNWMSTYYTVDFLAVWEQVNNPNFNRRGFHTVRNSEGRFTSRIS